MQSCRACSHGAGGPQVTGFANPSARAINSLRPSDLTPITSPGGRPCPARAALSVHASNPHIDVVGADQRPFLGDSGLVLPLSREPRDRRRGQAASEPRNFVKAGAKSELDRPCRYSSGQHLRHPWALPRPGREDRGREPLPFARHRVGALVVDPRRPHLPQWSPAGHTGAVADHPPTAVGIDLVAVGRRHGRRPQPANAGSSCRAPSRTISSNNDALAALACPARWTTLSMGRTFPNQRANFTSSSGGALLHVTWPRAIHMF
jgi:hypothetical protein